MPRNSNTLRYYKEEYLQFAYSFQLSEGVQEPICVICKKVRKNSAMVPTKLQQHYLTAHRNHGLDAVEIKVKGEILIVFILVMKIIIILEAPRAPANHQ